MNDLGNTSPARVREALEAVLTLHLPDDPRCRACLEVWPCTTVEKVREVLT